VAILSIELIFAEMSTDWQQHYLEQNTPWDKGAPSPPLLEWLERHPGEISGNILVPGCGLGHDVRALALACPECTVRGVDLSVRAIELAGEFPAVGREHFSVDDFFKLPTRDSQRFSWIMEHTCFCAIDPAQRDTYVLAAAKALRPGGSLLGVFYLNPYDEDHRPGEGPPHGTSMTELEERFVASGHFTMVENYEPGLAYPGREGLERMIWFRKSA
jgi:methyl halide transferase